MAKDSKETKEQFEEKNPEIKSGTKGSCDCGCGCVSPMKPK